MCAVCVQQLNGAIVWSLEINLRAILIDSGEKFEASHEKLVKRISISHFSLLNATKTRARDCCTKQSSSALIYTRKNIYFLKNQSLPRATCALTSTRLWRPTMHIQHMEIFISRVPYLIITSCNKFYLILVMIMYGTQVIFISLLIFSRSLVQLCWDTEEVWCERCIVESSSSSSSTMRTYLFAMKCWNKQNESDWFTSHDCRASSSW